MSSESQIVAKIVSALGGPNISAADIEWATEIPAGKKLTRWLVDQCVGDPVDYGIALRQIALEHEEIQLLKHAKLLTSTTDTIHAPTNYVPPSRIRKHAEYLNHEIRILEAETASLKSRIQQTKQNTQQSAQTIKSLQAAIDNEDAIIAQTQERLAELSIVAGTTISSAKNAAFALLNTLESKTPSESLLNSSNTTHPPLLPETAALASLASLRTSIISKHTNYLEHIQGVRSTGTTTSAVPTLPPGSRPLPSPGQLSSEASILTKRISALLDGDMGRALREAAFAIELQRICEDEAVRNTYLNEDKDEEVEDGEDVPLNVRVELEMAWALDQAALLDFECKAIDSTINAYEQKLLPELEALHTQLAARERNIRTAEAWVGALGVEVEGVREEVDAAHVKSAAVGSRGCIQEEEQKLEVALKHLLLSHHQRQRGIAGMSGDDSTPLVLLDRADILAELRRVQEQEHEEAEWHAIEEIRMALNRLSATDQQLLTCLYYNSPVNTSPPFASPPGVAKLEKEAQQAAVRLGTALGKDGVVEDMEKILSSSRTKRRLDAFVDRWTG